MPSLLTPLVGQQRGKIQADELVRRRQMEDEDRQQKMQTQALERMLLERSLNAPAPPSPLEMERVRHQNALELERLRQQGAQAVAAARQQSAVENPRPTSDQRRGGALLTMARDAYPILQNATAPGRLEAAAASVGLNEALSAERQQIEQAAGQLVGSYLYLVSGATATDEEIQRRAKELVPQPGDKPATLQRKRQALEAMMRAMEIAAGQTPSQGAAASGNDPLAEQRAAYDRAAEALKARGANPAQIMQTLGPRP